jgi:peptide deformylase
LHDRDLVLGSLLRVGAIKGENLQMSKLRIHTYPDFVLRGKSALVDEVDTEVVELVQAMSRLMVSAQGIGLAAPQVGVPRRIIIVNVGDGPISLINPAIVERHGLAKMEEGCLSCPGITVDVARSENILVRGLNLDGKEVVIEAEGLIARVLQHEIDHLNGVLILDKLPWLEKMLAKRKLRNR